MKKLHFFTQLSLDFIFSGNTSIPNKGEEVYAEIFDIQLGGGTLTYPIILSRLGLECCMIVKRQNNRQFNIALNILKDVFKGDIIMHDVDYDPIMSTAVISLEDDRSFITHNDVQALNFEDVYVYEMLKETKVAFVPENNYKIIPLLKAAGTKIVFDIGWSDDMHLDKYAHILSQVDYFTPNEKEALKMTGCSNAKDALNVLKQYVRHPVISLGSRGSITIDEGKKLSIEVPKHIQAVDTTGAGDNFMAGLIYAIYHDMPLKEAITFANCAGALSTRQLGVYGASYTLDDIHNMIALSDK